MAFAVAPLPAFAALAFARLSLARLAVATLAVACLPFPALTVACRTFTPLIAFMTRAAPPATAWAALARRPLLLRPLGGDGFTIGAGHAFGPRGFRPAATATTALAGRGRGQGELAAGRDCLDSHAALRLRVREMQGVRVGGH